MQMCMPREAWEKDSARPPAFQFFLESVSLYNGNNRGVSSQSHPDFKIYPKAQRCVGTDAT